MERMHRLRSSREFERVMREGARASNELVTCVARRAPGRGAFGVAAPRFLGGAVRRNRAKRRLREAVRLSSLPPGVEVVLIGKPSAEWKTFQELVDSVGDVLTRAGASC